MGILNLSPVAPLEATIRSDSRQNDVGLAVGFQNLYINMLRDPDPIAPASCFRSVPPRCKKAQGLGMGAG